MISLNKLNRITRKFVIFDITINIFLGSYLTIFPDFLNGLLFKEYFLPRWFYIIIGIGLLIFALWQVRVFIKPDGFTVFNLYFAAILAWIPFICLGFGLLSSLGANLVSIFKIVLWIANIYMFLLGCLYWKLARKIVSELKE